MLTGLSWVSFFAVFRKSQDMSYIVSPSTIPAICALNRGDSCVDRGGSKCLGVIDDYIWGVCWEANEQLKMWSKEVHFRGSSLRRLDWHWSFNSETTVGCCCWFRFSHTYASADWLVLWCCSAMCVAVQVMSRAAKLVMVDLRESVLLLRAYVTWTRV